MFIMTLSSTFYLKITSVKLSFFYIFFFSISGDKNSVNAVSHLSKHHPVFLWLLERVFPSLE